MSGLTENAHEGFRLLRAIPPRRQDGRLRHRRHPVPCSPCGRSAILFMQFVSPLRRLCLPKNVRFTSTPHLPGSGWVVITTTDQYEYLGQRVEARRNWDPCFLHWSRL